MPMVLQALLMKRCMKKQYPSDEEVRITILGKWLERSIIIFGLMTVKSDASKAELLEII